MLLCAQAHPHIAGIDGSTSEQSSGWAGVLVTLALLLLPARSADRKKRLLPFGRRGGIASGLLNAPRLSGLLFGFARGFSCSLGSFGGRSLCGFACYRLASDPLSFRDPDVAGCDDLRSGLQSPQSGGVFRNRPGAFNLGFSSQRRQPLSGL